MRQFILFLGLIATFCFTSCRNELDFEQSVGTLSFSKETVYLDFILIPIDKVENFNNTMDSLI